MNKQRSVRFNFIMNFILTASSFVFPLITYPYVSRVLMPEGIGRVSFATSVVSYFIMLTMLGVPTYGIRACAQVRDDKERLSKTVHELMLINVAMAAACYVLLAVSICLVDKLYESRLLIWVSAAGILLNAVGVNWFYSAIEEYAYITVRSLVFKALSVVIMFLFIRSPEDSVMYAVMLLVASSGSYIMNFARLRKYITFKRFEHYSFMPHIKTALVFFAMAVATTVYTNLDVVMLGFMSGDAQVGYYSTAVRVKQILVTLVTSLGTVLLPRLAYYATSGSKEEFSRIITKAMQFVFFVSVPLTVFFIICAQETVLTLSGEMYLSAVPSMQIIMPTVWLIGVTNILGMQIMVPLGREKEVTLSVAFGGAVDLIVNALLIPSMGAVGAAIGTLIAEFAVLVIQGFMLRGELRVMRRVSGWRVLLSSAAAAAAVILVKCAVHLDVQLFMLAIEAAVFGAVYLSAALIIKEPFLYEEGIGRVKQLLHKTVL